MFNEKLMILAIFLVSLLAVSAVSAADNVTSDFAGMKETADEAISVEKSSCDDEISLSESNSKFETLKHESDEALSSGEYDEIMSYKENNKVSTSLPPHTAYKAKIDHVQIEDGGYTVYALISDVSHGYDEDYAFHLKVYDSDNVERCSIAYSGECYYAAHLVGGTINTQYLKQGIYTIKFVNYIDNYVMDTAELVIGSIYMSNKYKNVNINAPNAYYNQNKRITYSWEGFLNGYFKIYKGNKLVYSKGFNTNEQVNNLLKYKKYSYTYDIRKIKDVGTFTVKIIRNDGKVLAQSTFKIAKASTKFYYMSFSTDPGCRDEIPFEIHDKNYDKIDGNGIVILKIFGKKYKTKVKHGGIKIKMPYKQKKYKGSAKFLGNKYYKGCYAKFTITVKKDKPKKKTSTKKKASTKKKSSGKKFTLKLKRPEKFYEKTIRGNHIYALYKYRNQGQYGRGVCIDSYGKGGPGTLKGIKLIKAKIYFKNDNGNTKVKTKKFDKYGFARSNLVSGYKPYKVVVFYK